MPLQTSLGSLCPGSLVRRAFHVPRPSIRDPQARKRAYRAIEGPAYNGVGTAASIARAYSAPACGGGELNFDSQCLETWISSEPPASKRRDLGLGLEIPFSMGYARPFPGFFFGADKRAFGMPGFGGSCGYADPATRSSFASVPNKWRFSLLDDPRQVGLWKAFQQCVAG